MSDTEKTPEEVAPPVEPAVPVSSGVALKSLWKNLKTPILMGVSAVVGAIIYAKATAEPSEDESSPLEILEINEVDPTE